MQNKISINFRIIFLLFNETLPDFGLKVHSFSQLIPGCLKMPAVIYLSILNWREY